jgi:hypothetical protein
MVWVGLLLAGDTMPLRQMHTHEGIMDIRWHFAMSLRATLAGYVWQDLVLVVLIRIIQFHHAGCLAYGAVEDQGFARFTSESSILGDPNVAPSTLICVKIGARLPERDATLLGSPPQSAETIY